MSVRLEHYLKTKASRVVFGGVLALGLKVSRGQKDARHLLSKVPLGQRGDQWGQEEGSQTLGSNPFTTVSSQETEGGARMASLSDSQEGRGGGGEQFRGAKLMLDVLTSSLQHNWEQQQHPFNMTLVRLSHFSKVTEKVYLNYSKGYTISIHYSALCSVFG